VSFWATWLGLGALKAPAKDRAAALEVSPLEQLDAVDGAETMVAGGKQTRGALPITSEGYDAALYSSRGRGYAAYNEDAAALYRDTRGGVYGIVLDQAGGLGGEVRGQASGLVANLLAKACQQVATGPKDKAPNALLLQAFADAHAELNARGQGEVTTAVVAVARNETVHVVSSGDSGAMIFDPRGTLRARSELQEFGYPNQGCLKHAVGLEPEGCHPMSYGWKLGAGEWLVLGSDGLLDSGLVETELGGILTEAENAEAAVNTACARILRRMGTLRAKPDNLTMVAIQRRKR
jgi:serine/threonine protein phosphatase PrpC